MSAKYTPLVSPPFFIEFTITQSIFYYYKYLSIYKTHKTKKSFVFSIFYF
nr:MAG TPA: hypothetical protein [Caudoviricetes sp.]